MVLLDFVECEIYVCKGTQILLRFFGSDFLIVFLERISDHALLEGITERLEGHSRGGAATAKMQEQKSGEKIADPNSV